MALGWMFLAEQTAGFLNGFARGALGLVGIRLLTGPLRIASWPGLLFLYTIALVPFAYVVVSPAFRNMDASLEEASRMALGFLAARVLPVTVTVLLGLAFEIMGWRSRPETRPASAPAPK